MKFRLEVIMEPENDKSQLILPTPCQDKGDNGSNKETKKAVEAGIQVKC